MRRKCVVKDCQNHYDEGSFVGDLCYPCWAFISQGDGVHSQAYRNALSVPKEPPPEPEVHYKEVDTYEVSLFLGSREGYDGRTFTEEELVAVIGNFQKENGNTRLPIAISSVRFVDGSYNEKGWRCSAICYPRWPQHPITISEVMRNLAKHLIRTFKQQRISVKGPNKTQMYYIKGDELKEEVVVQTTTIKDGYL